AGCGSPTWNCGSRTSTSGRSVTVTGSGMTVLDERAEDRRHAQLLRDPLDADRVVDGLVDVVDPPLLVVEVDHVERTGVERPLHAGQDGEVLEQHPLVEAHEQLVRLPALLGV